MLQLSATLRDRPVVSLRLGGQIAMASMPIINPNNLKIMGWWCKEAGATARKVLLTDDIREINSQGLAVNNEDALTEPEELVRHKEILDINFELTGMPVRTKRSKIGKVSDFAYNEGMFVQKLYVAPPVTKLLGQNSTHVIDRTQILEITNKYILVKDTEVTDGAELPAAAPA